jgi:hypothetical protein
MSSRRYVKRIHRVPKHMGAVNMVGALIVKLMIKHGWPVDYTYSDIDLSVSVKHADDPLGWRDDMQHALDIAVSIVARTYGLSLSIFNQAVYLDYDYYVDPYGAIKRVSHDLSRPPKIYGSRSDRSLRGVKRTDGAGFKPPEGA